MSLAVGVFIIMMLALTVTTCAAHARWEDPKACHERLTTLATEPAEFLYHGPASDGRDYVTRWKSLTDGTTVEMHYYLLPASQGTLVYMQIPKSFDLDREGDGFFEEVFINTRQLDVKDDALIPSGDCNNFVHMVWDQAIKQYVLITTGREML